MFDNTITVNFDGNPVELNRINQDAYSSEYYTRDGTRDFRLEIKHTFSKGRGTTPESHLVRFDVDSYDSEGVHVRTTSAWCVLRTAKGLQDNTESGNVFAMLESFMSTSPNLTKVLGRQS